MYGISHERVCEAAVHWYTRTGCTQCARVHNLPVIGWRLVWELKTGGIQRTDSGLEGFRTCRIQEMKDSGMERYRKRGMKERRDSRLQGYQKGGILDWRDTRKEVF